MKKYVKPDIKFIKLIQEERIAANSGKCIWNSAAGKYTGNNAPQT
jgi:hypothetical protein